MRVRDSRPRLFAVRIHSMHSKIPKHTVVLWCLFLRKLLSQTRQVFLYGCKLALNYLEKESLFRKRTPSYRTVLFKSGKTSYFYHWAYSGQQHEKDFNIFKYTVIIKVEKKIDAIIVKKIFNRGISKYLEQQILHGTKLISEVTFKGNEQDGEFL